MTILEGKGGGLEQGGKTFEEIQERMAHKYHEREEYVQSLPICPVCKERKEKDPCPTCEHRAYWEAQEARRRVFEDNIRLGGEKAQQRFTKSNYDNKQALEDCSMFPDVNLFIFGPSGSGKTHLGTAIIREWEKAKIFKPQHIYRYCRGHKSGEEEQKAINYFIKLPYIMIDDLGVDKRTDFSYSTLYEIIDGRDMNNQKGIIITSNLSLGTLAQRLDDDRISSRIAGMCKIVELSGKDRRLC